MQNLLFITIYDGIGGGESLQLNLMDALDRDRYQLHLITPKSGNFPVAAEKLGVKVSHIPFRGAMGIFIPAVWARFPIVSKLERYLEDNHIYAILSDYHALPYIVPAAKKLGIPVLWNAMGWWFTFYPWQRQFFREQVDQIIAITQAVKEKLLGTPPLFDPARMEVHIPGVDTERFKLGAIPTLDRNAVRAKLGFTPETPLVAMAARFQSAKGHDNFLDAAKVVIEQLPDAQFVVAGDNVFKVRKDTEYKERILARREADPVLKEHVTYLGFYPDVREIMAAADVMVCSSKFESLSMVALESMAMERPIVSTRVGGPSETIIEGVTGFLVPPQDSHALGEKVLMLLRDPDLRARMGSAGRQHVLTALSVERYAEKITTVLDNLMKEKPRS